MNKNADQDKKQRIVKAAMEIFVESPDSFTMKGISKKARVKEAEIYSFFPNKSAILKHYYVTIVPAYQGMIREIEGYKEYDLSEKLSNFVFSSLDMMQEQRDFVEKTFDELVFRASPKSGFQEHVEALVGEFMEDDPRISASNQYLLNTVAFHLITREYFYLVKFWMKDDSTGSEKTMALTDKLTALLSEVLYSGVLDKGIDLGRFLISNRVINPKLPFWDTFVERFTWEGKA